MTSEQWGGGTIIYVHIQIILLFASMSIELWRQGVW